MGSVVRVFGLSIAAVIAAWVGAAAPLAVFLLTGLPLSIVAGVIAVLSGLVAAFRPGQTRAIRAIVLTVAGGAAAGAAAQVVFSFTGGWSFGD